MTNLPSERISWKRRNYGILKSVEEPRNLFFISNSNPWVWQMKTTISVLKDDMKVQDSCSWGNWSGMTSLFRLSLPCLLLTLLNSSFAPKLVFHFFCLSYRAHEWRFVSLDLNSIDTFCAFQVDKSPTHSENWLKHWTKLQKIMRGFCHPLVEVLDEIY